MRSEKKRNERIVVLAIVGMLALNYPWLSLFSRSVLVFGIPLLYLYLFGLWALLILLAGLIIESEKEEKTETSPSAALSTEKSDSDDR
jgi:hypothetical protein